MTLHWKKDLIESCKKGNRQAQHALFDLYKDAMYNVALRMCNNAHDAEDILISSFTDVFRNIHTYDYRATPGAWIKKIVINNSITHLNKVRRTHIVFLDNQPDLVEEKDPPEDPYIDINIIKACIKELPQGYRLVLTLYLLEGYDHVEISDIMGISVATSKSQYSRARKKLKELVTNQLSHTG